MAVGTAIDKVAHFGSEGMFLTILSSVAPPDFSRYICIVRRQRVKH
jgi:hypothetical protein